MGLYERITAGVFIGMLLLGNPVAVRAQETYQVQYNVPEERRDDYTVVVEDLGEYEVCEGDSLWSISEKLLGDSDYYLELAAQNADVVTNPDLIYPQMHLQIKRNVYVKKRTGTNGIKTPEYRFGTPDGWRFGIVESGDVYANCSLMGDGMANVACLIRDKEKAGEAVLADWKQSQLVIQDYVSKDYAGRISDLTFYDYCSEDGRDLHLFSYTYTIDGEKYGYRGEMEIYVCAGVCQTEHIQAELTGFDTEEGIQGIVLYMLASFEELSDAGQEAVSVNGYNIAIAPSEPWVLSGIHNPFAWIDQYFDSVFSQIAEKNKPAREKTARERILGL